MLEIGASLRQARLARGLDLGAVEKATRIRLKYLQALEDERFDLLPAEAYARPFLREFAHALGLESRLFLEEYEARFAAAAETPAIVPPRHAAPPPLLPRRQGLVLVGLALLVGFLVAGGLLVGLRGGKDEGASAALRTPPARGAVAAPPRRPVTHAAAAATPRSRPQPAKLVLRASRGRCWVLVRRGSANGPKLYEGILEPGRAVRASGRRLWVRVGAPRNLDAWLDGKRVTTTLPRGVGNVLFART